jgi:hypothetical protein
LGEIEKSILLAITGAKHEVFESAELPVNILTCIDRADSYLSKHFFDEHRIALRDGQVSRALIPIGECGSSLAK